MEPLSKEALATLTDQQLLDKKKEMKSGEFKSALVIGIMIGIVIYSVAKNSYGFFTLIPLYFIYKLVKGSHNYDDLKQVLKERNL